MAKTKKTCAHCGAGMMEHRHRLCKGNVATLLRIYRERGAFSFNPYRDFGLTHSDINNWLKLRYWSLIAMNAPGTRSGQWQLTDTGREFCEGRLELPAYAVTYRGELLRLEGKHVGTRDVLPAEYWQRDDYAQQAQPHAVAGV